MKISRSKRYFLQTSSQGTWAGEVEKNLSSPAALTRIYMMRVMKPRGKVCASLCCGWGRFLRDYYGNGAKSVIGVDLNTNNLKICKQTGANLIRADLENLPIRDAMIECAECVAVMGHLENPGRAAREIRRVISSAGTTFITWNNYNWMRVFFQPEIRLRLLLAARDIVCDMFPRSAVRLMVQNRFLRPLMHNYGIFRYKGFSYRHIKSIYQEARMRIVFSNWLSDQGVILVEGVRA